jgi:hypothetical protein
MKKKRRYEEELPPAYEGVERHLMAVYYSGVYITNADIVRVGKMVGLDLAMKDRLALLKDLMHHAHETGTKAQMMQGFITILQERSKTYGELAQNFPAAAPLLQSMMQKARSTALLLQREMRSDPYA